MEERSLQEGEPSTLQRSRAAPDNLGSISGEWWIYLDCDCTAVMYTEEPKRLSEALSGRNSKHRQEAIVSQYIHVIVIEQELGISRVTRKKECC